LTYVDRNEKLSISRQCQLLDINRSTVYYKPAGESELNLKIMFEIDKRLIETPEYGSRTIADVLSMEWDMSINRKRVQRLMRIMGV
jgi:putative transposase